MLSKLTKEVKMSEENKSTEQVQSNTGVETTEKTPSTEGSSNNVMQSIPKSRFDEINAKRKDAENALANLKAKNEERDRLLLEEQGKFKEVNEKLKAENKDLQSKSVKWDNYLNNRRTALMENLSDAQKEIADGMPLEKLEKYVSTLIETAEQEKPKSTFSDSPSAFQKSNPSNKHWVDQDAGERRKTWKQTLDSYKK